MKIQN